MNSADSSLLKLSREAFKAASDSISDLTGTDAAGIIVRMGADGTPTARIDIAAEDAIFEVLKADGRSMRIISEETGERILGNSPEFSVVIDPLDGTYNASVGIPFYSISIAFASLDLSSVRFGYVSNFAFCEEYYAEAGKGAYLNEKRVKTSLDSELSNLGVSVFGYRQNAERTQRIYKKVRRVRLLGSVALELCYVASGKLDAFIGVRRTRVTDVAAGQLILTEAGGLVTDRNGNSLKLPDNVTSRVEIIASNGCVHDKLLKLLKGG